MQRTIPIIGIILILILSGIPTILSFENNSINQVENKNEVDWWPMFRHDAQNTGYSTSKAPNTSNICWTYQLKEYVYSSPIIYNGKVFLTTPELLCLDLYSGEKIWENKDIYSGSSPVIYENKLFLLCVKNEDFGIHCYNPDNGSLIWSNSLPSGWPGYSTPVINNNYIYVGLNNVYDASHKPDDCIICFNADNGEEIWRYRFEYNIASTPALNNDKLFFGNTYGIVYCLDAYDGNELWQFDTDSVIISSPTAVDNKVFIASWDMLYCLDGDSGEEIWSFKPSYSSENNPPPIDDLTSSPSVVNGRVYIGSIGWNDLVWCLNASTGEIIWKFNPPHWYVRSSPAVADGKIYFVIAESSRLCCLNADNGEIIWDEFISYSYYSSPSVADGKVVTIGLNRVTCFGEPPELEIGDVSTVGLDLNIPVINKADSCAAIDVNCNISIKGGFFNNINVSINKTKDYIYRNEETIFNFKNNKKSDFFIFSLGFIDITINLTSENAESVSDTLKGFIVGPFLFI